MRRRAKTIAERVAALDKTRLAHLEARAEPRDVGRGLHTVRGAAFDSPVPIGRRRAHLAAPAPHIVGATSLPIDPLGRITSEAVLVGCGLVARQRTRAESTARSHQGPEPGSHHDHALNAAAKRPGASALP